ncbi:MAG: type II secretion system protein [Deltaproteobacteria bacterium]|nr:type II secretion system protein [Deltaproteobacteria bacterium]
MDQKGITLIELLITVTILAVLASVVVPFSQMSVKRQKEVELRRNLRIIRNAIDGYKRAWDEGRVKKNVGESGYPPDLASLVSGVDDITSAEGRKIRFLRRVPPDPMSQGMDPMRAWGLRSYESDFDSPEEGDDVYDVYSKSDEIAIDGTPYRSW